MAERLSNKEKKLIEELCEKGLEPVEIAREVSERLGTERRDTRTVRRHLTKLPRELAVGLEKQQKELNHRNYIRRRINELKKKIEIPSPLLIWVPDMPRSTDTVSGEVHAVTKLGLDFLGSTIEWERYNRIWIVRIDSEFKPVVEHLKSSRFRATFGELEAWKQRVGAYIKACYELRKYIEREAKDITKWDLFTDTESPGLLEGFFRSIFWVIFSNEVVNHDDYRKVSEKDDLCLYRLCSYNLAWVREDDLEKLIWAHQKLIEKCHKLSITFEINQMLKELKVIQESLRHRLDRFSILDILPGKCELCQPEGKPRNR